MCLTDLFAPVWLSLLMCLGACFLYLIIIPFTCLLATLFVFCMYMLGARARLPGHEQQGQGCKQEDTSPKMAMFKILGGLAFLIGFLSPSLLAFFPRILY